MLSSLFHNLNALGPWVVFPIYTVALSFFISTGLLGLAAGAMFGTFVGFLVFSISSALSAALVFLAGRYFSRGWLYRKIQSSQKIRAIEEAVSEGGWKMVALMRQTSVIPFTAMNFGLGLSRIPFWQYFLATWVGMLPGSWVLAHVGALAGTMIFEGRKPKQTPLEWAMLAVNLSVTVGLSLYATKRVRKILHGASGGALDNSRSRE